MLVRDVFGARPTDGEARGGDREMVGHVAVGEVLSRGDMEHGGVRPRQHVRLGKERRSHETYAEVRALRAGQDSNLRPTD
jgi:hypothetical protein